jgi:hypothetical protein
MLASGTGMRKVVASTLDAGSAPVDTSSPPRIVLAERI